MINTLQNTLQNIQQIHNKNAIYQEENTTKM